MTHEHIEHQQEGWIAVRCARATGCIEKLVVVHTFAFGLLSCYGVIASPGLGLHPIRAETFEHLLACAL